MTDAQRAEQAMRRWIDLVAARDLAGLEAFVEESFHPEASNHIVEWARDAFTEWQEEDTGASYELQRVVDTGHGIAIESSATALVEGYAVENRFTDLFRYRGDKIASMEMFATPEEALTAATDVTDQ